MTRTKRIIAGGLFCLCVSVSLLLLILPERLQIYGKIQEAKALPADVRSIFEQSQEESSAEFYAFYFAKSFEAVCDCSAAKRAVARRGGRLEVIDSKIAPFFDIPHIHNGVHFQLADSVLITVADTGKVLAIHRGINSMHLVLGIGMPDRLGRSADAVKYGWNKIIAGVAKLIHYQV